MKSDVKRGDAGARRGGEGSDGAERQELFAPCALATSREAAERVALQLREAGFLARVEVPGRRFAHLDPGTWAVCVPASELARAVVAASPEEASEESHAEPEEGAAEGIEVPEETASEAAVESTEE